MSDPWTIFAWIIAGGLSIAILAGFRSDAKSVMTGERARVAKATLILWALVVVASALAFAGGMIDAKDAIGAPILAGIIGLIIVFAKTKPDGRHP